MDRKDTNKSIVFGDLLDDAVDVVSPVDDLLLDGHGDDDQHPLLARPRALLPERLEQLLQDTNNDSFSSLTTLETRRLRGRIKCY